MRADAGNMGRAGLTQVRREKSVDAPIFGIDLNGPPDFPV
jgi:hypothetical protein